MIIETTEVRVADELAVRLTEYAPGGTAGTALVLHGGGGVPTVRGIAEQLADRGWNVVLPTHPGWDGTARPDWCDSIEDIALGYQQLLRDRDAHDVLVVGSSLGGWIGAELTMRDAGHRIGRLIVIDGVGVDVPAEPITDFFALDPRGVAEHSYHDPDRFFVDPTSLAPEQRSTMAQNVATMRIYAGDPYMHDPRLARRLGNVATPTTLLWGDSDRIVTPAYGRAFAAMFPCAQFAMITDAGHLPQLEQPEATFARIAAALA